MFIEPTAQAVKLTPADVLIFMTNHHATQSPYFFRCAGSFTDLLVWVYPQDSKEANDQYLNCLENLKKETIGTPTLK
jgi:hypothetical protein